MLMFRPLDDLFRIIEDRRTDVVITGKKLRATAVRLSVILNYFFSLYPLSAS